MAGTELVAPRSAEPCARTAGAASGPGVDVSGLDIPGLAGVPRSADGSVPGPVLAGFLSGLDVAALPSDHAVLEVAAGWERVTAWVQAAQLAVVAEFVRRPEHLGPDDALPPPAAPLGEVARGFPAEELAVRLASSARDGADRVALAVALTGRLPATAAALAAGG